jgi:uncharacterized SAM-binding protein YcdF (DUF218 family)
MFELGKIAWLLLAPANLLLLVLLVVFLAVPRRRAPRAKGWLGVVVLAMVLIACTPLSRLPLTVLENRFAGQALPQKVDGVIVLGGGITPAVSLARNEPAVAAATPRLLAFADLARRLPEAKLVFTGGSGDIFHPDLKEAPLAKLSLAQLGVDVGRVVFEDQARNTYENARFSRELVQPKPGEVWLLVTSAAHMPRAMGTFRALGWDVRPWPVGYWTSGGGLDYWGFDLLGGLSTLQAGAREWIGLAAYYVRGYTDSLLPAPH